MTEAGKPMQWHPLFAELVRPLLRDYYEILTDVPVGDLPRQADIVLLRRSSTDPLPFHGIWQHLTPWNVVEFKGPTVDPRLRDLDLLIEVGLGIDRRQNEERHRQRLQEFPHADMSFWYVVRHLGQRFLPEAGRLLGPLQPLGDGLWRCVILDRPLFLVSADALPIDSESVPLHLLHQRQVENELAVAQLVIQQPGYWQLFSAWLAYLYPDIWEEVQRMARANGIEPDLDFRPLLKMVGVKQLVRQVGLKEIIDSVGLKEFIDQGGLKQVIEQVGLNQLVSELTPEQKQYLKTLLEQPNGSGPPASP